ncbi:hypothetical protein [Streptomyces broussonetiae]|uniref:Uncharacterized protein n=1 Tax=Streptomyces broussonetiae TaxID=2686304 RepID=A0ABV5E671_9ACTN
MIDKAVRQLGRAVHALTEEAAADRLARFENTPSRSAGCPV